MTVPGGIVLLVVSVICGSRPCPENCKKIPSLLTCTTDKGACSRGCVPGYYGNTCNMTCDINCEQGLCQRRDGTCTCKPGYTFNTGYCDSLTGVSCESNDNCLNNKCLSARRPDCLEGCKPGWFGKYCKQSCSLKCVCHKESGICTSCIPGWYGEECGSHCSPGCVNKKCDRNGTCVGGCRKGYYGPFCRQTCNKCIENVCEMITGECLKGCQSGHYGTFCRQTCENCDGGACDKDTGECSGKWTPYIIGGGTLFVVLVLAGFIACCLIRIQGAVYNIEKRRRPSSAEQDVRPVAAQGYFELEEQVTIPPRPMAPIRQTSYIEPRHSGNFGNLQIQPQLQAAGVSDQQNDDPQAAGIPHSDILIQKVQRRSDESSERPDSYVSPHYCEVNEEGMATPPQPTQGPQAPTSVVNTNFFSVAADVNATRGEIRIPPIAECFVPTGSEDSLPDLQPLVENYDHLNRGCIPRIGGDRETRSTQDDDEVRVSLAMFSQMSTERPDYYIEPRHSDCAVTSQQQMLSSGASDQQKGEQQASGAPHSDRLLHAAMIAEAPAHGAHKSVLFHVADEQTNGGESSIPLIAECFGPTETKNSSSDDEPKLLAENYDHLFRDHNKEH